MDGKTSLLPTVIIGYVNDDDVQIISVEYPFIQFYSDRALPSTFCMKLMVFNAEAYRYTQYMFPECTIVSTVKRQFDVLYEAKLEEGKIVDESLLKQLAEVQKISRRLIHINNGNYDEVEFLQGYYKIYPYELNSQFPGDYEQIKRQFIPQINNEQEYNDIFCKLFDRFQLAFSIDNHVMYRKVTGIPIREMIDDVLRQDGLLGHPIFGKGFSHLSIGNEFCYNLLPKPAVLQALVGKATDEGFSITIAYPILFENHLDDFYKLLKQLEQLALRHECRFEVTVNDWGTLQIINEQKLTFLKPVLGRLLNKRIKDSRIEWKWKVDGYDGYIQYNMLNSQSVRQILKDYGVERYEFEEHHHPNIMEGGPHSLFFPYFQMCTSVFCHMFLTAVNHKVFDYNRVEQCPHICEDVVSVYPSHLKTIGKGNTIYGYDSHLLEDPFYLKNCLDSGVDRLIYTSI